ncbi:MAG: PAS domain S-box protein [Verrucomicrobiota bacterium]
MTVEALQAEVSTLREELGQQRAERNAVHASEQNYRRLFDSVDDGFCIIEVLFDEKGKPFDYLFIETNKTFEKQTGFTGAVGRTMQEFYPNHENFWYETYGKVAATGESTRFENNASAIGRHYDVNAVRVGAPGENRVAVLFRDITERKRREANVAFLDLISKDLARLSTQTEIMSAVGGRVGEYLGLSGCVFGDVRGDEDLVSIHHGWTVDHVPTLKQTFRLGDYCPTGEFQEAGRAGETFVVTDTGHDPRTNAENYALLKVGAFVTIPFHKLGKWTHYFALTNTTPRIWRQDEIELLQEITARLFPRIERASADEELSRRAASDAFRVALNDALRPLTDLLQIQEVASRLLGEHLHAQRVTYAEIVGDEIVVRRDYTAGVPSMVGRYPSESFGQFISNAFKQTGTYVQNDAPGDTSLSLEEKANYQAMHIAAFVAMTLVKKGHLAAVFAVHSAWPRQWSQDEISLIEEAAERVWATLQRVRAEEAVRESEEKYRTLFNATDQALGLIEVLYDTNGKPVDIWYVETNPTFYRLVGFEGTGKKVSETLGEIDQSRYAWYDQILKTGEPARIEYTHEQLGQWFTIFASRVGGEGSRRAIVVFDDITERKRREQRQGFLVKLGDALRDLSEALEIKQAVMRVVGETLQVDRVLYADVMPDDNTVIIADNYVQGDFPKMTGSYKAEDFGLTAIEKLRAGETLVVQDIESTTKLTEEAKTAYLQINTRAQLVVPLCKRGRWVSNLAVHHGKPRQWTADEVSLLQEAAERTWAAVERAVAEDALRASEERLNAVANVAPDLLWRSEADGSTAWYNDRWTEYTSQTLEQSIGWGWVEAIHPDERAAAVQLYREAVAAGRSVELEQRIRRGDGQYRWHLIRAEPLRDAEGRVLRMYGSATDIHDLREAAEAQRIGEERFRVALEAAEMAAWEYDIPANRVLWNEQHFHLLGLPVRAGQLEPEDLLREVHPEDDVRIRECLRVAVEETGQYRADFRIIRADTGEVRWMSGFGQATRRGSGGLTTRIAGVMIDITERKHAEAALREAKEEAEAASRAKDDFLAALSHELRNPLNPVLLSASDLAHDPALPEAAREQLKMIHRNIELEARLIDDLLDLTRIAQGKMRLQRMPNDVHALLRHTEEIVREDAAASGVALEFNLEAEECHVMADAARLQQVFWNIIKNGIKFSGSRGGQGIGRVCVRTFNAIPGRLTVEIQDNGVGISPAMMAKIFRPFEQGEHGGHRFGGLGLGLTIAKKVMDLHDGELRAASAGLGQGSTFAVELATVATSTIQNARIQAPAPSIRPLRLLVVEDHEPTIQVLSRVLQRDGHQVHMARSASEALKFAESGECDLVVSDIGLPDRTGVEMMRELRQLRGWRGIALSGYGMETDIRESLAAGFVAHLVKPLNIDSVRKAIREAAAASLKLTDV